ncbi:MAG: hypothetical protein LBN05_05670 [Oscillospiraceae bacterium]|jgi:hypothetical protein|nr:hypothetical protein [Oscillospiraceae bacterium]
MRKNTFLRRINRGLVLAVALIVALSATLVVQAKAFRQQETPEITRLIEEFALCSAQANLVPGAVNGQPLTDKQRAEHVDKYAKLFAAYLSPEASNVNHNDALYMYPESPSVIDDNELAIAKRNLEYALLLNSQMHAYVSAITVKVTDIDRLKPLGSSGYASCSLTLRTEIEYVGYPQAFVLSGYTQVVQNGPHGWLDKEDKLQWEYFGEITDIPNITAATPKHTRVSYLEYSDVMLKKTDDGWRIVRGAHYGEPMGIGSIEEPAETAVAGGVSR